MLQEEHSAILSTSIKLQFPIKTLVLYIFKWPLKTGFTVFLSLRVLFILANSAGPDKMQHYAAFHLVFSVCQSIYLGISLQVNKIPGLIHYSLLDLST